MNVEIGTEAAQFPEKEYINVIFVAVCRLQRNYTRLLRNYSPAKLLYTNSVQYLATAYYIVETVELQRTTAIYRWFVPLICFSLL